TPSTARTTPVGVKKCVRKSSICNKGSVAAAIKPATGLSTGSRSFKSDTHLFDAIFDRRVTKTSEHATTEAEKAQGRGRRHERQAGRDSVDPPRFPENQRRRGGERLWAAVGLGPCCRDPDGIRRLEIPACCPRAEPEARRHAA